MESPERQTLTEPQTPSLSSPTNRGVRDAFPPLHRRETTHSLNLALQARRANLSRITVLTLMKPEPAKLGGFLARKHHGQPGSQTIGTEYEKTAQRKMKCACRAVNPSGGRCSRRAFNLGRARLLPSRQPLGGRCSRRAVNPLGGRGSRRAANPWEGDAPAEPDVSVQ